MRISTSTLIILACITFLAIVVVSEYEELGGTAEMKPSVNTPPTGEYNACIKITGNRTAEEMMVYHPDKTYKTTIDNEGHVLIHFNMTLDEFGGDVMRFAGMNVTEYDEIRYNATTLATVGDFFDRCPVYGGEGQCVSRSRYIAFEAQKHGLNVGTCVIGGAGSAQNTEKHQVNTFLDGEKRYYTSNLNTGDTNIYTAAALLGVMNDVLPHRISSLSPRDFWHP